MRNRFALVVSLFVIGVLAFGGNTYSQQATSIGGNLIGYAVGDSCTGTGQVKYDDSGFENGGGWANTVTEGRLVMKMTPPSYPWKFTKFCMGITRTTGADSLQYDVIVYDTTGAGGTPGTVIATITNQVAKPIGVYPAYTWFSTDVSSIPILTSGSYYFGFKYNASLTQNLTKFLMIDQGPSTPLWPGYAWNQLTPVWTTAQTYWAAYRSFAIRTIGQTPVNPVGDSCTGTGQIKYDDSGFENGGGWAATVTEGRLVMKMTPPSYPWKFTKFCMGITRTTGADSLQYDVIVYDTTGAGGTPGTVVATITNQLARPIGVYPSYTWFSTDVSSIPVLNSGSYYFGFKYNASLTQNLTKFLMIDQGPSTPLWPGYAWNQLTPVWTTAQTYWAAYRSFAIRTIGSPFVGITPIKQVPSSFNLSQNYPNPFNPSTKISFSLPKSGIVKLSVFDILGKEVATLVDGYKEAGFYDMDFDASALSSGVYFYRIDAGDFKDQKKMLLIK